MNTTDLNCDILSALENEDLMILPELKAKYEDLRNNVASEKQKASQSNIDYTRKEVNAAKKLSNLLQEIQRLKIEIEQIQLEKKIVEQKIFYYNNQHETHKNQITEAKEHRESLTLELINLQQQSNERKLDLQKQWRAIKKAGMYYKRFLNFRIDIIEAEDHEKIQVSFFTQDKELKNQYCAYISREDNSWKVESIHPQLKDKDLKRFDGIIDFSKRSEILDVTAFLCELRGLFLKSYH